MTKRLLGALLMLALGATVLFAQSAMKSSRKAATEHKIQKLETSLWQAWKDHNARPFDEYLTGDSIDLGSTHNRGKTDIVKEITSHSCKVTSFSLSGFAYLWLDANSLIITYTGMQEGSCNGNKLPAKVNASSVWVKRGGKWMNPFHQESPAM